MRHSDSYASQTLLDIARQRQGFNADRCQVVFGHLDTAVALQAALLQTLTPLHLSELKFDILVVLYAMAPESATPAELAAATAVTRSSVTEAVEQLVKQKLVERKRDLADRRNLDVSLTTAGQGLLEQAVADFLHVASDLARLVEPAARPKLQRCYAQLKEGAVTFQPDSVLSPFPP